MAAHPPGPTRLTPALVAAAERHLADACPVMRRLVAAHGHCTLAARNREPFHTLCNSIISQQLSSKAAESIHRRVGALVGGFTPAAFLAVGGETLRSAGLSAAKARTLCALARAVSDGDVRFEALHRLPDAEVTARLVALQGIGPWTAQMFLIFGLKRADVLSPGDAGLCRAVRRLFGDGVSLEQAAGPWRPYRSVASWYLWRSLDA
ncbi:MAG: DNA-3-methyladenine glycosylase 2 family protein [Methylobacteriaceae bacterium]|jgi:DNA-3-methyladenine glycosylase II|nr:DNA-3-methyladenine glycosylase 2 family protein [Methylobacteriaceae bacterium]